MANSLGTIQRCRLKVAVSAAAFLLWSLSLALPVFATTDRTVPGWAVLFATFAWGISTGIGIPFAVMNVGLLYLFWQNLRGKTSRSIATAGLLLSLFLFVAIIAAAQDYPQWNWTGANMLRIGVPVWFQSMVLMSIATCMRCVEENSSADRPPC